MPDERYDFAAIEPKWQQYWAQHGTYRADDASAKPRFYALTMYPYPSGEGLHVGHARNYVFADIIARYQKMHGHEVLYPMGWDAFGLPAENHAIKIGVHPRESTWAAIRNMKSQLGKLGCVYDWDREVATCEPDYYRWTQWLFLRFFEKGLAYRKEAEVNWCPGCQTVLANEQVVDGLCERSDDPVERRRLEQWFFRITEYADRLLSDLSRLDHWPERVRVMQANWIGRSEGLEFDIPVADRPGVSIPVFTTRPDTVFGMTFVVLSPEHPLVAQLGAGNEEVEAYVRAAGRLTDVERMSEAEKTGVPLGLDAVNPANEQPVPIWVADYVLMGYGTGAIMAVPGQDQRDWDFAKKYGLPIVRTVQPPQGWEGEAFLDDGPAINSDFLDGLQVKEAKERAMAWFEERGLGQRAVNYRLRDWLVSRQRYWGAPIPVVYCDTCGIVAVPVDQLPVLLPLDVEFRPTGQSPLTYVDEFVNTECPACAGPARRETDTMDTFVDSSWYFLRFCDPHNDTAAWDPEKVDGWMPVDQYLGGIEHAVLHLLYARFFTKVVHDLGLCGIDEPFTRLFNQGMIYKDGAKMSKSKGNTVTVDDIVDSHGSDAMRVFQLHIGPPEQDAEWQDRGIEGASRFLNRVWRLVLGQVAPTVDRPEETAADTEARRGLHRLIRKVTDDLEAFAYNTAVAATMECVNDLYRWVQSPEGAGRTTFDDIVDSLLRLTAPMAPHVSAELWDRLGKPGHVHEQPWPESDPQLARRERVTMVIQVNGKVRDRAEVDAEITEDEMRRLALESDRVSEHLDGGQPRQVVTVPPKLVNVVV